MEQGSSGTDAGEPDRPPSGWRKGGRAVRRFLRRLSLITPEDRFLNGLLLLTVVALVAVVAYKVAGPDATSGATEVKAVSAERPAPSSTTTISSTTTTTTTTVAPAPAGAAPIAPAPTTTTTIGPRTRTLTPSTASHTVLPPVVTSPPPTSPPPTSPPATAPPTTTPPTAPPGQTEN